MKTAKNNQHLLLSTTIVTALSLMATLPVFANSLATEDFNYPDGNLGGQNGGTGWTSSWTDNQGFASVVSGQANINSTSGQQIYRTFAAPTDGTIWLSFDAQLFTTASGSTDTYGGLGLFQDGTEKMLIGKGWPGNYIWGMGVGLSFQNSVNSDSTLNVSTLYAKLTLDSAGNTGVLDVWINPSDTSSQTALGTPDMSWSDTYGNMTFDQIWLRGGVGSGETESWNFDNLALGTTLTDVTAVPEPQTVALLGMGALLFFQRIRRKK